MRNPLRKRLRKHRQPDIGAIADGAADAVDLWSILRMAGRFIRELLD